MIGEWQDWALFTLFKLFLINNNYNLILKYCVIIFVFYLDFLMAFPGPTKEKKLTWTARREGYSLTVCLSVTKYSLKILCFTCEAIQQWKEHLLFCKHYVCRNSCKTIFDWCFHRDWHCKINFEPNFACRFFQALNTIVSDASLQFLFGISFE